MMENKSRWLTNLGTNQAELVHMLGDMEASFLDRLFLEGRKSGVILPPTWLVKFIVEFARQGQYSTVLDPWSGIGLLIRELHAALEPKRTAAIIVNESEAEAIISAPRSVGIDWHLGKPLELLDTIDGEFSLIASIPPMGFRSEVLTVGGRRGIDVRDSRGNLVLLKSCLSLSTDGIGLFVVPQGFTFHHGRTVYHQMSEFGLNVNATLSIPAGSFSPYTGIPSLLIIVSRQDKGDLFVGELSDDTGHNRVLLENLLIRQHGERLELGALVKHADFSSFEELVQQRELQRLITGSDLSPVRLADVTLEINLTKSQDPEGFEEKANAIFLPKIGRSDAVTSRDSLKLKAHNYAQIILDPQKANASYVASFFNSPLGQLVRERNLSGSVIPKLTKTSLDRSTIYLPPIEIQIRTIEVDNEIRSRLSDLSELRQRLWSTGGQLDQVIEQLSTLGSKNEDERLESWMEKLPFPLASILWTYQASGKNQKERYEHLIHFFEALAEYLATILLSAYLETPMIFDEVGKVLDRSIKQLPSSTFGTWFFISKLLTEDARIRRDKKEGPFVLHNLFRTANKDLLDVLLSKRTIDLLENVKDLRNTWIGHTGYVSSQEARSRHALMQQHLITYREIVGTRWQQYQLLKPGTNEFDNGVYMYEIELIMGSRTPFVKSAIQTTIPLQRKALYVWTEGESRPLRLLPLVRIMTSPTTEEDSCYFYNRVNEDMTVRYVAYHFGRETEIATDVLDIGESLKPLLPNLFND